MGIDQACTPSRGGTARRFAWRPLFLQEELVFPMARIRNVFEIIELYGHDENFEPHVSEEFIPTAAPAGSREKIDVLAERIQRGMPLWHPEDSTDSAELLAVGAED